MFARPLQLSWSKRKPCPRALPGLRGRPALLISRRRLVRRLTLSRSLSRPRELGALVPRFSSIRPLFRDSEVGLVSELELSPSQSEFLVPLNIRSLEIVLAAARAALRSAAEEELGPGFETKSSASRLARAWARCLALARVLLRFLVTPLGPGIAGSVSGSPRFEGVGVIGQEA